jgi:hypothetical protein
VHTEILQILTNYYRNQILSKTKFYYYVSEFYLSRSDILNEFLIKISRDEQLEIEDRKILILIFICQHDSFLNQLSENI